MTIGDRFFGSSQNDPMLNDRIVPQEVLSILEALERRDEGLAFDGNSNEGNWSEPREIYGEDLVPRNASFGTIRVNTIPGIPGGCYDTLVVGIGESDSCEKRILQALAHCATTCRTRTKFVVINAAIWDGRPWMEHRESFKALRMDTDVMVIRRMLGEKAYTILI